MNKFTIITKDGELIPLNQWQNLYGLAVDTAFIGKYFKIGETSIKDGGKVSELVIRVLDRYREIKGVPVKVNSLDRSEAKQKELIQQGYRAATFSPHVYNMAADIDTVSKVDTINSVPILRQAAKELGIKIRIGFQQYMKDGSTFIHFDVCPEYYATGKPFNYKPHPKPWESEIVW